MRPAYTQRRSPSATGARDSPFSSGSRAPSPMARADVRGAVDMRSSGRGSAQPIQRPSAARATPRSSMYDRFQREEPSQRQFRNDDWSDYQSSKARRVDDESGPRRVISKEMATDALLRYLFQQMDQMKGKMVDLTEEIRQYKDRSTSSASASASAAPSTPAEPAEMYFITVRDKSNPREESVVLLSEPRKDGAPAGYSAFGSKMRVSGSVVPGVDGGGVYLRVMDVDPDDGSIQYFYMSTDDVKKGSYSAFL